MGGHYHSDLFSQSAKGRCYGNRFSARIGENCHTPPAFCTLASDNGWEDRNMDARFNTADGVTTSDKNLVIFGSIILQARSRRASYTMGFATHFQFYLKYINAAVKCLLKSSVITYSLFFCFNVEK